MHGARESIGQFPFKTQPKVYKCCKGEAMFGYVTPRRGDLLVREHEFYRAAYCGVCRAIRKRTGLLSSFLLSYDLVFLALCRMTVTDPHIVMRRRRCPAHPFKRRPCLEENEALDLAARASAILTYEKLEDDRRDASRKRRLRARLLLPIFRRAARRADMPSLLTTTQEALARLSALEDQRIASVDAPAHEFGELLGAVFAEGLEGETRERFFSVGYHLGKFIYAADALDDLREDAASGDYNPYLLSFGETAFRDSIPEECRTALYLELSALSEAVEGLPFEGREAVEGIIKNIIYLGLSDRIQAIPRDKTEKKARKNRDRSL